LQKFIQVQGCMAEMQVAGMQVYGRNASVLQGCMWQKRKSTMHVCGRNASFVAGMHVAGMLAMQVEEMQGVHVAGCIQVKGTHVTEMQVSGMHARWQ
jgi:hypothetical protein